GAVNSTSTEAVNGSQLYSVQQSATAGWNVSDGTNHNNIGPNGKVTFGSAGSNLSVTESGNDDDANVTVALASDLDLSSTGSVAFGSGGLTLNSGGNGGITNLAAGTLSSTSTDAVNGSQLY